MRIAKQIPQEKVCETAKQFPKQKFFTEAPKIFYTFVDYRICGCPQLESKDCPANELRKTHHDTCTETRR